MGPLSRRCYGNRLAIHYLQGLQAFLSSDIVIMGGSFFLGGFLHFTFLSLPELHAFK